MKLRIDIITLFPELIRCFAETAIVKRAQDRGLVFIKAYNLRAFSSDRYRTVDDYPYGGGPGMVLKPEPIYRAVEFIKGITHSQPRVLITSPQGRVFKQSLAENLSLCSHVILICGRYQGIDQRVVELCQGEEISVGDYILSGGELPAMIITEAITRLVPEVLGDEQSIHFDSFYDMKLGPPQYTRPRIFKDKEVPEVLTSGDHGMIEEWRRKEALRKTRLVRPDLLERSNDEVIHEQ
ncbi:MAG TPA: tRNA (guanosine(37)-N1)-methyltransferase TrmD [Candidatus Atribacteria bacterium]|nr:tRNA (guanosine(37)-N1)-methyltransferase TrmD [Candidatus Atribacteria bacterium]